MTAGARRGTVDLARKDWGRIDLLCRLNAMG